MSASDLINRRVSAVIHYAEDNRVRLVFEDGKAVDVIVEGDCCSSSYYVDPSQFDELVGAVIRKVEPRNSDDSKDVDNVAEGKYLRWHFLVFVTDKGHVTIDFRNESNGYYSGFVEFKSAPADKGSSGTGVVDRC
jgi:hypothetical protein